MKKQMTIEEQVAKANEIDRLGAEGIDASVEEPILDRPPVITGGEGIQGKEVTAENIKLQEAINEVSKNLPTEVEVLAPATISGSMYDNPQFFNHIQRVAKVFASSSLIPDHYKGNLPNCIIGVQMALRLGVDVLMYLQCSHVVHGKPGIEGKLATALINAKAPIKDYVHFDYTGEGDSRKCTAWCIHKSGDKLELSMTIKEVKEWGWYQKSGSMWPKMPDQMLAYRTSLFLIRRYFPEVLLGLQTVDEIIDVHDEEKFSTKLLNATVS